MNKNSDTPKTGEDKDIPPKKTPPQADKPAEIGGRGGLDPVRYGDWEIGGKCVDF